MAESTFLFELQSEVVMRICSVGENTLMWCLFHVASLHPAMGWLAPVRARRQAFCASGNTHVF